MGMISDFLPFRAVRGFFGGAVDGWAGQVDTSEHFPDGDWENDTTKKSQAGRVLSNHAGVLNGEKTGKAVFGTLGAVGAGAVTALYLVGFIGATMMAPGIGPFLAAGVMAAGAAVLGGMIGSKIGAPLGMLLSSVVGATGGALVGTYSAVFRRGAFQKDKEPEPSTAPSCPEAKKGAVGKDQGEPQQTASDVGLPGQEKTGKGGTEQEAAPQKGKGVSLEKAFAAGVGGLALAALARRFVDHVRFKKQAESREVDMEQERSQQDADAPEQDSRKQAYEAYKHEESVTREDGPARGGKREVAELKEGVEEYRPEQAKRLEAKQKTSRGTSPAPEGTAEALDGILKNGVVNDLLSPQEALKNLPDARPKGRSGGPDLPGGR